LFPFPFQSQLRLRKSEFVSRLILPATDHGAHKFVVGMVACQVFAEIPQYECWYKGVEHWIGSHKKVGHCRVRQTGV